jgi:Lactate racemase N-terminal domain
MSLISLEYGATGRWEGDLSSERLLFTHSGPAPISNPLAAVMEGVHQPIEFPALELAMVPGDRVVIVLDRGVPSAAEIISGIWSAFVSAGIEPGNVLILQPASMTPMKLADPRRLLPVEIREQVVWKIHDPTVVDGTGYLASSAAGERLYLSREVLDADFVLPIGRFGFDAMLGRRELTSAFYPGLSNPEAFAKTLGQGHQELGPDDERPLRQLVNEVAWLLGIQFAIQVLPSRSHTGMAGVLMGNTDRVAQRGRELLDENWRVTLDQRGETALVAIPTSGDETTWADLGAAVEAARQLIVQGGKIIVLSDLAAEPGAGVEMIGNCRSPKSALQPLRKAAPPDVLPASQIAAAADWASVYLLSQLDNQLVERLYMIPIEHEREVIRLLQNCDGCIVLAGAQHVYGEIHE